MPSAARRCQRRGSARPRPTASATLITVSRDASVSRPSLSLSLSFPSLSQPNPMSPLQCALHSPTAALALRLPQCLPSASPTSSLPPSRQSTLCRELRRQRQPSTCLRSMPPSPPGPRTAAATVRPSSPSRPGRACPCRRCLAARPAQCAPAPLLVQQASGYCSRKRASPSRRSWRSSPTLSTAAPTPPT